VRALYDDASENLSAMTRDYVLELDTGGGAPLLSVFGGKITTYRTLAERVMEKLQPYLPAGTQGSWTAKRPLPGGEAYEPPAWLDAGLSARWQRQYGSCIAHIIADAGSMEDLGKPIAPHVYEAELRYVREHEWAQTADDFLWRRTKLGLTLDASAHDAVAAWFAI
jgi:glycerol-3-phosphate dehydrogenase